MKTKGKRQYSLFLIAALLLFSNSTQAQIVVSPASEKGADGTPGFYYALPRHVVKVDLIIQQTKRTKGPYSEYSAKILGTENYVKQDETLYNIVDAMVTTLAEPDPDAWYFVEFDERSKDARSLVFEMQNNGLILAVDDQPGRGAKQSERIEKTVVNTATEQHFQYFAERNVYRRIDTIVRKITIDTTVIRRNILKPSWVDYSPEQKAAAAANFIEEIRENRFDLLSGLQEKNFGQGIDYVDRQLQALEQEYLSLFLGIEEYKLIEQTIYYYPSAGANGIQTIGRFSETGGIVSESMKGENIQLVIRSLNLTSKLHDQNESNGKAKLTNAIYYRFPDEAELSLIFKGKLLKNIRAPLSQNGFVGVLPLAKTLLQFDAHSGSVMTIKRE